METDQRIAGHSYDYVKTCFFLLSARRRLQRYSFFSAAVSLMVHSRRFTIKTNKYQSVFHINWIHFLEMSVSLSSFVQLIFLPSSPLPLPLSHSENTHCRLCINCMVHTINTKKTAIVPLYVYKHLSASCKLVLCILNV